MEANNELMHTMGNNTNIFILTESALEPILKLLCHSLVCVCVVCC